MQDFESVKKVISEMLLELNDNLAGIDESLNAGSAEQPPLINAPAKEIQQHLSDLQG